MLPITKVSSLLLELSETKKYDELVKRIQIPLHELSAYINWEEEFYTRNCILRNDDFELLLLCWEPGQQSPIHSHNQQECWIFMVDGELKEQQYQLNEEELPKLKNAVKLTKNNYYYTNDDLGFHSLSNSSKKRAVSLHLYAKPIDSCSYFSEESNVFKTKNLSYTNPKYSI